MRIGIFPKESDRKAAALIFKAINSKSIMCGIFCRPSISIEIYGQTNFAAYISNAGGVALSYG